MAAVAVLPARGGSKRIPFKNGRAFHGRPMMGWPISVARDSGHFDRIVVSTDNEELAGIARAEGAETPFMRDAALADDHSDTSVVVQDAIRRLNLSNDTIVACIYPTAAFLTADDLRTGFERLEGSEWVFTVGKFPAPIQRAYAISDGVLLPVDRAAMPLRSQDLGVRYYDAGQFYLARAETWTKPDARVWDGAASVVLPRHRCVDIDTEEDWAFAEKLFGIALPERVGG